MTRLPVMLDNLRIASPCQADWDEMAGDERVRFCGRCEKNVYNLSAMTRDAAEALVSEREGRVCVRFYQRQDGTLLSADCPAGVERRRFRQRVWSAISSVAASLALLLGLLCGRARADLTLHDGKKPRPRPVALMGGPVAMPQRPPLMGKMVAPEFEPPKPRKK
jgi:hypothetical protein